jgi:hypothetical protein
LSLVADPYFQAFAPHDHTVARFTFRGLEQKFSGAGKDVGGHKLSPCIGHIEDLATHAAMPVIKDDERLFQRSASWGAASFSDLEAYPLGLCFGSRRRKVNNQL